MLGAGNFPGDPYATVRQMIYAPPDKRKTFVWDTPSDSHYRTLNCAQAAEVGECNHYAKGFVLPITDRAELQPTKDQMTAMGYTYTEGDPPVHLAESFPKGTRFLVFPPEQRCMNSYKVPHRVPLDHDPILSVRGGDFRYFTGNDKNNLRSDSWVAELQNTVGELNDEIAKG